MPQPRGRMGAGHMNPLDTSEHVWLEEVDPSKKKNQSFCLDEDPLRIENCFQNIKKSFGSWQRYIMNSAEYRLVN